MFSKLNRVFQKPPNGSGKEQNYTGYRTNFFDISDDVVINPTDPTSTWNNILSSHPHYGKCSAVGTRVHDGSVPKEPGIVRFVCISDTHGKHRNITMPNGDVLLHAGDITNIGEPEQFEDFIEWLEELPHREKVVIAGNHDLTIDTIYYNEEKNWRRWTAGRNGPMDAVRARKALCETPKNRFTYLEDNSVTVTGGYKIYGSPSQPEFYNWAFNLSRGEACASKWEQIPNDTDILMTHGPPIGHGDVCSDGQRAGCVDLLATVADRVKPLFHVFGHIHEGYGATTNGETIFINASTCTLSYKPTQAPLVFDLPIKQ